MSSSETPLHAQATESTRPARRSSPHLVTLGVIALLALLSLLLSWPLAAHLSTRLPGTETWAFDESTFAWNTWYFKHALLDQHTSPLHSSLIWYPLGIDLVLYTYNFFNAAIALPVQLAFNLPLATNLALLLATMLSGLGAYLLARYVLAMTGIEARSSRRNIILASIIAGLIFAFASNRAIYAALGHYDMVTTQWLPFYALYLLKTLREPLRAQRLKNAFMAGLFFALAAYAEMSFASFLALMSVVIVLAGWREWRIRRATLGGLAVAALTAALIWSPALVPIAREFLTGDYALEGWGESVKLSADAVGLVTPTNLNPVFGGNEATGQNWRAALRAVEEGKGRFSDINTAFLGWVTLALAVVGAWVGRRRVRPWTWVALVFGALSLGPLLQVGGRYLFTLDNLLPGGVTFPLPFILLHYIPFINGNRAPNRNSVILMLSLAVLAAYAVAWVISHRGHRGRRDSFEIGSKSDLATANSSSSAGSIREASLPSVLSVAIVVLLAAAILVEHLSAPLPTTDAQIPAVYRQIAAEPGDFAVMQLPLGWRNSFGVLGSEQTNLQYFQTGHGKAMIGGNISRAPASKMEYFARIPLFRALTDLEMYQEVSPELDAAARAQAADLMALYNVRYFVTTPPIPGRYPYQDTWQRTEQYALDVLPLEQTPVWEADGYRVYRVIQPPLTLPFRIDVGAAGAEPYLGAGWDVRTDEQPYEATANWITGTTADVYLPLDAPRDARVSLSVAPLAYDGAPPQTLTMRMNGQIILDRQALNPGWQAVTAAAPASIMRQGPNHLELEFAWAASPRKVFPDPSSRALIGSTGVQSPVNLELHAFSEAFMTATNADGESVDASAGRQGYNVAVFDAKTGKLLDKVGFDTTANTYEADALAAYLRAIPRGRIVALATKGDAAANLTPASIAALAGLGSRVQSPADLQGQAHALVGVQGSQPGSASEAIARDAYLAVTGDFRSLAAAVDWVELGE
jgi:hypothetical protein